MRWKKIDQKTKTVIIKSFGVAIITAIISFLIFMYMGTDCLLFSDFTCEGYACECAGIKESSRTWPIIIFISSFLSSLILFRTKTSK